MQARFIQASAVVLVTSVTSMGSGGNVLSVQSLTFVPRAIILESTV